MREAIANPLAYYASQSYITDAQAYARLFENLPTTLPELCHLIQGIVTDHVVCEYWKGEEQRWALVDAQVDDVQRQAYQVEVDTYDIPRDALLLAGEGWRVYRSGGAGPNRFGISSLLDRVATLTLADNSSGKELYEVYENEVRLRVPPVIKCYAQAGVRMVNLTAQENPL